MKWGQPWGSPWGTADGFVIDSVTVESATSLLVAFNLDMNYSTVDDPVDWQVLPKTVGLAVLVIAVAQVSSSSIRLTLDEPGLAAGVEYILTAPPGTLTLI